MGSIAVIAHARKSLDGGLPQLREVLASAGFDSPDWYEVTKSKRAPKAVLKALKKKPDVLFAWGGDGTVQRVIDTMAGSKVPLAILPTGTANLFATNLGIPKDLVEAVQIGLEGDDVVYDTGIMNGEHFAVMAGAGADARMIEQAVGSAEKSRFVDVARGKRMTITFAKPTLYELDGGEREAVRKLKVRVAPHSITVRVPATASATAAPSRRADSA